MKSLCRWLGLLALIAGAWPVPATTAQTLNASQPGPDSTIAIQETVPEEILSADTVQPQLEMVNPASYGQVRAIIAAKNAVFPQGQILAMGFKKSPANATAKTLIVIALNADGQPQKHVYTLSIDAYHTLANPFAVSAGQSASVETPMENGASVHPQLRQDGRVYFMLNTTLKSLWVYPGNMTDALGSMDDNVLAGLSLLTLGGSLYGSYLFTQHMELGYGRVEFMNYGGDLGGITYPLLVRYCFSSQGGDQASAWMGILGFPAGIYLGSKVTFAKNDAYGNASIMTSMSKFGLLYGFLLPIYFFDNLTVNTYAQWGTGLSMALIPAGFYVGSLLVGDKDYSSGRSVMITTTGIMGALTGLIIPTWFESVESKVYVTTTLAGHMLGTYIGFNYRKDQAYTFGQGIFTAASALVGAGLAEALPLIARAEAHQVYSVCGLAGAWGGFALGELMSRSLFEKFAHDKRLSSSISFPGLGQLPLLIALQCFQPHLRGAPGADARDIVQKVNVMEIVF